MCFVCIKKIHAATVRIHAILPAVNVGQRDPKAIRVLWDRRVSKGMPAVPARKETKAILALWGHRAFPALLAQEGQEETPAR